MIIVIISLIIAFTIGLIIGEYREKQKISPKYKTYDELLREIIGNAMYDRYQDGLEKVKYRKQYLSFKFSIRNYININDWINKN